jgi:hypothetical protein
MRRSMAYAALGPFRSYFGIGRGFIARRGMLPFLPTQASNHSSGFSRHYIAMAFGALKCSFPSPDVAGKARRGRVGGPLRKPHRPTRRGDRRPQPGLVRSRKRQQIRSRSPKSALRGWGSRTSASFFSGLTEAQEYLFSPPSPLRRLRHGWQRSRQHQPRGITRPRSSL